MFELKLPQYIVAEIRTSIAHEGMSDGSIKLLIPETVVGRLESIINQQIEKTDSDATTNLALTSVIVLLSASDQYPETVAAQKGGLAPHQLKRVADYIESHLAGRLTVNQLAAVAGLSRNHFGYAFRQSSGSTPREFVLSRRIERAKKKLLEGADSIAAVALSVGFANQSHFTTRFRRLTGLTPGQFRHQKST